MTIYRVLVLTTTSKQPLNTFWQTEVLYCGTDRDDARVAYHASEPLDYTGTPGNPARITKIESIDDSDNVEDELT